MDTGNNQNLQKAQQNVKLALNIVETIEATIKKDLAKDSNLRSGDNCPLVEENKTFLTLSQGNKDNKRTNLVAPQGDEKSLKQKLTKALDTIAEQNAKLEDLARKKAQTEDLKKENEAKTKELTEKGQIVKDLNIEMNAVQNDLKSTQLNLSKSQQLAKDQMAEIEVLNQKVQNLNEKLEKTIGTVHEKDQNGNTKLHLASRDGRLEDIKLLLELGADVNARNNHQWTPLHNATVNGHNKVAKFLLQNGSDVHAKNIQQDTSLHLAANAQIAELLIEHGADVDDKNRVGWTPLHSAAYKGHLKVVEVLLRLGARKDLKNDKDETPLQLACKCRYGDFNQVMALLSKKW